MSAKKWAYVQAISKDQVFSLKLNASDEDSMRKLTALQRGDTVTFEIPVFNQENYVDHLDQELLTLIPANLMAVKVLYYTEGLKDVTE